MKRSCTLLPALFVVASMAVLAQGRIVSTFPYVQTFGFVTGTTAAFPAGNVDGGEFTSDAGTGAAWTASIGSHGINNNGGAGGALRLQSTASSGPAGIIWYGDFTNNCADSLVIDWSKVANPANGTRLNELRVATNDGAGTTFNDLPVSSVAGGAWPQFDNQAAAQSGVLRAKLPPSLSGSPGARVRIYSINVGGSGNQPRVVIDNLSITVMGAPPPGVIDSIGNAGLRTLTLFINPGTGPDSVLVIRRVGMAPTAVPTNGARYNLSQGLNATDTVVFIGPNTTRSIPFVGLQFGTAYYFAVYGLRTCNNTYSGTPATGSGSTLACSGAPAAVFGITALQRWQDSIRIGYSVGSGVDSVLVIRRRNAIPAFVPVDGTRYGAGQGVNATDTVIYVGPPSVTVTARALQPDSTYGFVLYGLQSCNGAYSPTAGTLLARTYCAGTVTGVTDVLVRYTTADAVGLQVEGAGDATGFIVFSNGPDTLRPVPVAGLPYVVGNVVGDDTVRYIGSDRRPIVFGLNPATRYRFTAMAVRLCNYVYATASDTVSATTLNACAGGAPAVVDSVRIGRNVRDTLRLRWRPTPNATGYLVVARIDSTPAVGPLSGSYYLPGDSLGSGAFVLGKTVDSTITFVRLPANTAYFLRVYALRACDLAYSPNAVILAVATIGSSTSQRFALRSGGMEEIRFAGSVTTFTFPLTADGSLLITRDSGSLGSTGLPMLRNNDLPITALSANRWWHYAPAGLGSTHFDLKFDITGIPGIEDTGDLEIVFRTESRFPWEDFITTGYVVDSTGHYLVGAGRDRFSSDYAIGASAVRNTLPVKLASFEGHSRAGRNLLRWRTAAETDNAGFRLYRASATDGQLFMMIADYASDARLVGAGTTNTAHDYGYVDASGDLRAGGSYIYRLDEVSADGSVGEVGRVVLSMEATNTPVRGTLAVAPNPTAAASVDIGYALRTDGPMEITFVNVLGETVRALTRDPAAAAGVHSIRADLTGLPAGAYFCRIVTVDGTLSVPVTVLR